MKKVEPVYPPLAKMTAIQGTVVLQVRIGKDGSIAETKVKSGNAVEATTTVEVPFSLGITEDQYKKEQESNDHYFKQEHK